MRANRDWLAYSYPLVAISALLMALYMALGVNADFGKFDTAIAYVNGEPIPEAEYARALDAMQSGLKRKVSEIDKTRALELLINEELIVQDALKLGLASSDRLVRKNLVQSMIKSATSLDPDQIIKEGGVGGFF